MIKATFKREWVDADSLPMCSFSERDEMFLSEGWEYELPEDYRLFSTKPKVGLFVEVVGEKMGQEILIGYACPVFYILCATVFSSYKECYESEWFHPSDYQVCREQDIPYVVSLQQQMLEDECYGD